VPKGVPDPVISRLERAFVAAARSPEFQDFVSRMGANVEVRGAREFDQLIAREDRDLAALMEQIGLRKQ
jgi:tripartite-type tricarboxylate transporter receptor subunit TctC